ncbi:MAG TPA: acyltransferase [Gemmatimonadaceae bacterium]|nr:acyltransferase [Gemmatimonadaceae bacterium]
MATAISTRTDVSPGGALAPVHGHIPALDGLRGIAILLVMYAHFTMPHATTPSGQLLAGLSVFGLTGVDLFFVLSGFLITGILADARGTPNAWRNFYARRVLRIFPLYYGYLAVVFLLLPAIGAASAPAYRDVLAHQGWYWAYAGNVWQARHGQDAWPFVNHFWTLAVEEQFYLVWPMVVLLLPRRGAIAACAAMVLGALLARVVLVLDGGTSIAIHELLPTRVDTLAMGALVALLAREPGWWARLARHARAAALAAYLAFCASLALAGMGGGRLFDSGVSYTALAVMYAAMLVLAVGATPGSRLHRVLCGARLRAIGRYSYGLYVLHLAVARLLLAPLEARGVPTIWGSTLPAQLALWGAGFSLSLALAWASWRWYETPFLALKRYVPVGTPRRVVAARVEAEA